jgi:hypothetical protein
MYVLLLSAVNLVFSQVKVYIHPITCWLLFASTAG